MKYSNGRYLDIDLSRLKIRLEAVSGFPNRKDEPETVVFTAASGGSWSSCFKSTGYEAVVIRGCSETQVYLFVAKDRVSIKSAEGLWELDSFQTKRALRNIEGSYVDSLCISCAGESLPSSLLSQSEALMRSMNLKAVVVKGRRQAGRTCLNSASSKRRFRTVIV